MSSQPSSRTAVVIGGGVIGVASAHYLMRDGWQVTLVDRAAVGSGCSHANCGFICPSHVLPLAEPSYPSVSLLVPAAHWDEREAKDLLGIVPVGLSLIHISEPTRLEFAVEPFVLDQFAIERKRRLQ